MNLFTYEKGYCFVYYLSQLCGDPQRFDDFLRVSSPLPGVGVGTVSGVVTGLLALPPPSLGCLAGPCGSRGRPCARPGPAYCCSDPWVLGAFPWCVPGSGERGTVVHPGLLSLLCPQAYVEKYKFTSVVAQDLLDSFLAFFPELKEQSVDCRAGKAPPPGRASTPAQPQPVGCGGITGPGGCVWPAAAVTRWCVTQAGPGGRKREESAIPGPERPQGLPGVGGN